MRYKVNLHAMILKLTQYNDFVLAALVVSIICLMILPIPIPIVDLMITINLCCAIGLLMLSLYIPSSLSLSTFPTLLLLTTLFRLALNITTTRQILLHANAGKIIYTFGNLVVGGNYVVGGVVFLIITIVQFLVIAKGSERVAEVAARFTLDAMPGKQMSIDADLRAGVIDMGEAKIRRLNIENESKLFGAMDGAMKFVKGDAIAGLIITVINIIGGIFIGTLQKHMVFTAALQKYTILTIGDGLVSQIPALFISITSGIIVTRVNVPNGNNLGNEIGDQVFAQPKSLFITGLMIIAFALVPGFPKIQFILIGTLVGCVGSILYFKFFQFPKTKTDVLSESSEKKAPQFSLAVPLLIDVSQANEGHLDAQLLNNQLRQTAQSFYHERGIPAPEVILRFNEQLPKDVYFILVQEIPQYHGKIVRGHYLADASPDQLQKYKIKYTVDEPFLPNIKAAIWVEASQQEQLHNAYIPLFDHPMIICHHFAFVLRKHAVDFIGYTEARYLLDQMENHFSHLVQEALQTIPIQKMTEIFQRLAHENVSLRNLKLILQSIIEWGQKEKDVDLLTEYVRMDLKQFICYQYRGENNTLNVFLLDPDLEETFRNAVRKSSIGTHLSLPPEVSKHFVAEVRKQFSANMKSVILTAMDIRRHVKKLVETELQELPVISFQELVTDVTIRPLGKISL